MAHDISSDGASYLSQMQDFALTYPLHIVAALIVFHLLRNKFQRRLVSIPGPTLAAYTKFWRVYDVWNGQAHQTAIKLHRKHGSLVRIAPNVISVGDYSCIPIIYNIKENYTKSDFYPLQYITWKKKIVMNIFSTQNPDEHRSQKRKIGAAFTQPNLLESEGAIDSCIRLFTKQLDGLVQKGHPIDLGAWLQYFAFDVVGEFTFARKLGFLEQGKDVDGMIKGIEGTLSYVALCGQVPEYHKLLRGNPLLSLLTPAMETYNQVLLFTLKTINERALVKDGELISADTGGRDMLSKWAYVKSSDPSKMDTKDIMVHTSTNVFAGSDTTAIALRAVIYYLCRSPGCMKKVLKELAAAEKAGKLSTILTYKESNTELRYFHAVIKEAMRIHPSVGFLLERHVPPEGAVLCGHFIPGGTIVGINPWVTNRDASIFPDPDLFMPERWLETPEPRLKVMESVVEYNFGAGSRKCIGRNISIIELQKVLPQLFREYKIELSHPEEEWHIKNHWFVQQDGLVCNLTRRTGWDDLDLAS
ncbi:hypothetical protein H2202_001326 [Exophiala xenobiotica]|nr:hypothetical protein H2202_001326 [Exophiala xenobiotica]KAK5208855.1 hypothetical protein LTR41_005252 [Exophiala xenobiotica]KAK5324934.1 hypothetical protein LTR93_004409 [Exophiala xenobiotica]KAK5409317.1 hypothetical protein LTR06_006890 [Exophiala xenobiotica]